MTLLPLMASRLRRLLGRQSPDTRADFQLRNISFVAGSGGLGGLLGRACGSRVGNCLISKLFFTDGIGDSIGLPEEIEVSANSLLGSRPGAKGVVIERITALFKLVSEAIVGIFEVKTALQSD